MCVCVCVCVCVRARAPAFQGRARECECVAFRGCNNKKWMREQIFFFWMRPFHSLKSSQVRPPRETGRDAAHRHRNARRPCRTSLGACSEVQAAREGAVAARAGGGGEGAAPRPVLANCACWSVCWHALPAAAGTRLRAGPCARCTPLALPGCSPITHCAWRRAGKRRGRGAKRLARLPPRLAPPPKLAPPRSLPFSSPDGGEARPPAQPRSVPPGHRLGGWRPRRVSVG